jgi:DNA polymerase-3 subunit gamma/tau
MQEYKVLARKYRPQTFRDLVGQDVLVRTLSNAIATNRIAHAFVLTGIRGIGKTTTARIIAKALNCIGEDGSRTSATSDPCGVCSHCVQIRDDRHVDVLELDAASNTGVDNAREIIESARYKPVSGRYKVYIIDEAHMLSNSSFNALLKTLEEPPANVVFVFATTELRKIPVTILSRCQRFDLRRLNAAEMVTHLQNILNKEEVDAEQEALELIAIASEGSVRDALSLMDQAISHSEKNADGRFQVQGATLRHLLGLVDRTRLYNLLESLCAGDCPATLQAVQDYHEAGAHMVQLVQDVLHAVHDVSRVLVMPNYRFDHTYGDAEKAALQGLAAKLSIASTSILWQILMKGLEEVRKAPDAMRATEMLFIRVCYAAQQPDPTQLLKQLRSELVPALTPPSATPAAPPPLTQGSAMVLSFPTAANIPAHPTHPHLQNMEEVVALCKEKGEMITAHHLHVKACCVKIEHGCLTLADHSPLEAEHQRTLLRILQEKTGASWQVVYVPHTSATTLAEQEEKRIAEALLAAKEHAVVKAVLNHFDDAVLVAVK